MPPDPAIFHDALVLTGPTGSGKSALALELAPEFNAEIIALDSMTLYKGMDIGTAKPTRDEQDRVQHHLIDVLEPWESGSVAWWLERAAEACLDIRKRGKQPLLVGGTPFYLKALLHGLFEAPAVDPAIRLRLEAEVAELGAAAIHARLADVDPISAARLHVNDVRRVIRALEVFESTGRPISALQQTWTSEQFQPQQPATTARLKCVAIIWPRVELVQRLEQRVQAMFAAGWLDEVRKLRALPQPLSKEASQALGYPEIGVHLDGQVSLEETMEQIQIRTRQYAKRQLTWFRHLPGCEMLEMNDNIREQVLNRFQSG